MPTDVIMPALELAQETGTVIRWLVAPGAAVTRGQPLLEIETDKVTVEIEAPASGVLQDVTAQAGDVVPVGRAIARIAEAATAGPPAAAGAAPAAPGSPGAPGTGGVPAAGRGSVRASPLARVVAEQHGVDLAQVPTASGRVEKADVLAHLASRQRTGLPSAAADGVGPRLVAASPKARRLAAERGVELSALRGSGPDGAVLAADVAAARAAPAARPAMVAAAAPRGPAAPAARPVGPAAPAHESSQLASAAARPGAPAIAAEPLSATWRRMAERMTASWTTAPHFYLVREVVVGRLAAWLEHARRQPGARVTYTDLLVKLVAAALARHPAVNAAWAGGGVARHAEVNVGLAVAIDDGLVVPVLHRADALGLAELAARREDLVSRAQAGRLRPADVQGAGFTVSNLGMYGVDAFSAILNPPQAAILAVGRIADRVVPVDGQPAVRPTMTLTLSCDHRSLDGARAAQFLGALADLVEEPLALLD